MVALAGRSEYHDWIRVNDNQVRLYVGAAYSDASGVGREGWGHAGGVESEGIDGDTGVAFGASAEVAPDQPWAGAGVTDAPTPGMASEGSLSLLPADAAARLEVGDGRWIEGHATHYGESYNGQTLGCSGAGVYRSENPRILAVSPARYAEWPCGTEVEVCGSGGCAVVVRVDSCPGCSANVLDLSEAANRLVCGVPEHTCRVRFRVVK